MSGHPNRFVRAIAAVACLAACRADAARESSPVRIDAAQIDAARALPAATLTGAGATFPFPLYARWFSAYAAQTGVRINYQPIGSGAGIRQLLARTVDFGATDVPMSDNELAQAPAEGVVHVPTVMGAVAIAVNLPGITDSLRLSGDVLAALFLGDITRWNDPRVAALNPHAALPDRNVLVVHRADGSGTTYLLSDYLTRVSDAWARGPGRGKDLMWPVGIGAKGNEGVASQIRQIAGAIGYIDVVHAHQLGLAVALLRNHAGNFVGPTVNAIRAAADTSVNTDDPRASLVNGAAPDAYPIAAYTWLIFVRPGLVENRSTQFVEFLRWTRAAGQPFVSELGYVPLPRRVAERALAKLDP